MSNNEIIPDDKDWTWVLERPCMECGFDASATDCSDVADLIRSNGHEFASLLEGELDSLRRRTQPNRWSTLEYAAHVRDVHRLYLERLTSMLEHDDPLYPNWDQDATAVEDRYNDQDPATVGRELVDAANELAATFDSVAGDDWQRVGRRSDGASFTVDTFSRYLAHDPVHHLWDTMQQ